MSDIPVKCCRCRHTHAEADRVAKLDQRRSAGRIQVSDLVCPRCRCTTFYDLRPQVAWCWASGLIEIGDALPADGPNGGGAIEIATGPKYALKAQLAVLARHGQGASAGKLLVPGVPEADDERAKCGALAEWLKWCGARKSRDGVTFSKAQP